MLLLRSSAFWGTPSRVTSSQYSRPVYSLGASVIVEPSCALLARAVDCFVRCAIKRCLNFLDVELGALLPHQLGVAALGVVVGAVAARRAIVRAAEDHALKHDGRRVLLITLKPCERVIEAEEHGRHAHAWTRVGVTDTAVRKAL